MNRRTFVKTATGVLCGLGLGGLLVPKAHGYVSANGLGKYMRHWFESDICMSINYGEREERLSGICFDDPEVTERPKGSWIWLPVENRVTIEFERGRECYVRYNLRKKAMMAMQSPKGLFEGLREEWWRLGHVSANDGYSLSHLTDRIYKSTGSKQGLLV